MPGPARRLLTAEEAGELDRKAVSEFGMPVLLLMENAGRAVSDEALKWLRGRVLKTAVFCGSGNNGGDGLCAARHLVTHGIKPDIYLAGDAPCAKNEAGANLDILLRMKQKIIPLTPSRVISLRNRISAYGLIVDALLGVGIKGAPRYMYQKTIETINSSSAYILSVDIPSGMQADSGEIPGACIKADKTVTFVARKRCMALNPARKYCGRITVRSIGIAL
ncbi:MAG: NAD(P)H-hydrate epimerase [Candidatus Omnitrophota bacterium]